MTPITEKNLPRVGDIIRWCECEDDPGGNLLVLEDCQLKTQWRGRRRYEVKCLFINSAGIQTEFFTVDNKMSDSGFVLISRIDHT